MDIAGSEQVLLEEIARVFHETGVWPVWQYVDKFLDHAGIDAGDAAAGRARGHQQPAAASAVEGRAARH